MLSQTLAITEMNIRTIPARLGSSAVIVVGIGGVVAVLIALLSMASGFQSALTNTANPNRAILLGHGSSNEMNSWFTQEVFEIFLGLEGIEAASNELYVVIDVPSKDSNLVGYIAGRGVTYDAFDVRPELQIISGRRFEAGRNELLVGISAARQYDGLQVGDTIPLRDSVWTVSGHFETGGTISESEIFMDLALAKSVFRRNNTNTARVLLKEGSSPGFIQKQIDNDPRLDLSLIGEDQFYAAQSKARVGLMRTFTYFIASTMAIGAIIAALNSMYVAVSSRGKEIATLRALGFSRIPIISSIVLEAMTLSLLGAAIGAAFVHQTINGLTMSTLNGASFSQVVFDFSVTSEIMSVGFVWALALGAVGGLFPAIYAARVPILDSLHDA